MTATEVLSHLAAGLRMALTLFAFMMLLSRAPLLPRPADALLTWGLYRRAWSLIALAAVAFSPIRAAYLLNATWPTDAMRYAADAAACGLACAAFIIVLSARARAHGLARGGVRRGVVLNLAIILAFCGVAFV